jgi:hypothetical protein
VTIDAINKVISVTQEAEKLHEGKADLNAASAIHANKFYAQRNLYVQSTYVWCDLMLTDYAI